VAALLAALRTRIWCPIRKPREGRARVFLGVPWQKKKGGFFWRSNGVSKEGRGGADQNCQSF
jgi:hypothetical protein